MQMPEIRGQDRAREQLAQTRAQAIALIGPPGVGRRLVARWYGALLNCREPQEAPCGTCESCRAMPEEHPDFREIVPADTTATGRAKRQREFRIDQLVERPRAPEEPVSAWLAHRPRFRWRVAVIDDAELLNAQAANAFLKTLEEPPTWARIVLIAPSMDALLPTIASRCVPIRCAPVSVEHADFGADVGLAPHPALVTGRIGPLERARRDPERWSEVRQAVQDFLTGITASLSEALTAADALERVWTGHDAEDVTDLLRFSLRQAYPALVPQIENEVERCERAYERYANTVLATRVLALALRRLLNATTS